MSTLEQRLERERQQLPLWLVVGFGLGIAIWFTVPGRQSWVAAIAIAAGLSLAGWTLVPGRSGRALGWFAGAVMLGVVIVWGRSDRVEAPRIERPMVAQATGIVEQVDTLAAKGRVRVTMKTTSPGLPPRVRVSGELDEAPAGLAPGARISVRARFAPPPPMALPGTYDFARDAWFKGIGAVGKALGAIEVIDPAEARGFTWARDRLRSHIARKMPDSTEGIAIALATGDQNSVPIEDAEAMRRSGLTHLLSVSGLHIAAVVGAAMLLTLRLLALSRTLALRLNLIIVAAGAGAVAGIAYTLLTGAQVPTVRSCVAALLVLGGIALGRDALSLRLIATGALLVLIFRPEALAGASFQMSFAAVTAIVALHSTVWVKRYLSRRDEGFIARTGRIFLAMVATGLAVEVALIPIALFHFHKAGLYGVAANIIAIPLTTFVIMPLEGLALLMDTIGLGAPFWALCSWSIAGLLGMARLVAGASGAVATTAEMPVTAFALMVGGGLWICLWESSWRRWGAVPIALGAAMVLVTPAPDLLITGDGKHLAVVDSNGVPHQLRDRSGDYVRSLLAEASGYDGDVANLSDGGVGNCSKDACIAQVERGGRSWRITALRSRDFLRWSDMVRICREADIVVADRRLPEACTPQWLKLDRVALQASGGVTIALGARPPVVRTVAQSTLGHPWAQLAPPAVSSGG